MIQDVDVVIRASALFFYLIFWGYAGFILICCYVVFLWADSPNNHVTRHPKVLIVCTARNEGKNLVFFLQNIAKQTFKNFTLTLYDDDSHDNTWDVIVSYQSQLPLLAHKLVRAYNESPKKAAITHAIASNPDCELVVCTDADCTFSSDWIGGWVNAYLRENFEFASGLVSIYPVRSLREGIQSLELASLMVISAGTLRMGVPTMANGANMAFRREAFLKISGYQGNESVISGDDEFLLFKMQKHFPSKVRFILDAKVALKTTAQESWSSLISQKQRWASKWKKNQSLVKIGLALLVFVCNLSLILLGIAGFIFGKHILNLLINLVIIKLSADFLITFVSTKLTGNQSAMRYFFLSFFIYPFYVLIIAILANAKTYHWKGRTHRT